VNGEAGACLSLFFIIVGGSPGADSRDSAVFCCGEAQGRARHTKSVLRVVMIA
jgi:hypothetical protein